MADYPEAGAGRQPAFSYPSWHAGPDCVVGLIAGPTATQIFCSSCRVLVQLDTVATKVSIDGSHNPRSTL